MVSHIRPAKGETWTRTSSGKLRGRREARGESSGPRVAGEGLRCPCTAVCLQAVCLHGW